MGCPIGKWKHGSQKTRGLPLRSFDFEPQPSPLPPYIARWFSGGFGCLSFFSVPPEEKLGEGAEKSMRLNASGLRSWVCVR